MNDSHGATHRRGYLFVILAAILFGISGTAAKSLFNGGITAFQLIQMRTTLASVGLFIWLGYRHPQLLKIQPKWWFYFFCLGVFGIGSAQFFYLLAISKVNVAAAILLHYTGPIYIAMYAFLIQRKPLGLISIGAIIGSFMGCFLVVGAYNMQIFALNKAGIGAGFLAAVAFAVYSLLSAYGMQKHSPWTILTYGMLCAAMMWNILHPPMEAFLHAYAPAQWGWIIFIGLFGTIIPFGLYFEGIKRIEPTHASVTATLEPISAAILATLFLGEVLSALQIIGALIVIIAITVLQMATSTPTN